MSRADFLIHSEAQRSSFIDKMKRAPLGFHVTCKRNKRSTPQNARMWAMLTTLSVELAWHGQKLSPEDWKLVMLAGLNQELRMVPNIEGNGFVHLGRSSSRLTKEEFTQLMDLIDAFASQHGVSLKEEAA